LFKGDKSLILNDNGHTQNLIKIPAQKTETFAILSTCGFS